MFKVDDVHRYSTLRKNMYGLQKEMDGMESQDPTTIVLPSKDQLTPTIMNNLQVRSYFLSLAAPTFSYVNLNERIRWAASKQDRLITMGL